MKLTPISLGTQSNPGRHQHGGVARHVNCRIEEAGDEARVKYVLQVTQGLARFATLDAGSGIRGMYATETDLYVVAGRVVYRVSTGVTATVIGGLPSDGAVFMARNGRETGSQIGLVCDGTYYIIAGGVMTEVLDPDLPPPSSICFLGGYFFFTTTAGRFAWSELDAGDTIDGLSIGTARESPDGLVVCAPRGRDLLLYGTQSLEIWTLNDGSGDAPVSRRTALHGFGALSAAAVVDINDTAYWLGTNSDGAYAGLYTLSGDVPQRIANPAFDRVVQGESSKATITSTHWTEDGRTEIAWSGTDWTWVLDLSTGKMHERSSDGINSRWRVSAVTHFGERNIAGDATLPRLYEMSKAYLDEDYADLTMICQPPPLHDWPNRVELNLLALDVLPGSGAPADTVIPMLDGDGTPILDGDGNVVGERSATEDIDPQVWLKLSLDGINWSGPIYASMGREQQRLQRVVWHALGTSEGSGYHLQIGSSAAVARALYGAAGDIRSVAA